MTISKELFYAVLAMDSYNRGYDRGLEVAGTQIGLATLTQNSGALGIDVDVNASFFAQTYQLNGEAIVSFRGTDSVFDAFTGFDVGAGDPDCAQAYLAADFYRSITGTGDPYGSGITLTGHSLGGGLAGLVAGVYGQEAVIFDNMAFRAAEPPLGSLQLSALTCDWP